jgi:hypothetical protein
VLRSAQLPADRLGVCVRVPHDSIENVYAYVRRPKPQLASGQSNATAVTRTAVDPARPEPGWASGGQDRGYPPVAVLRLRDPVAGPALAQEARLEQEADDFADRVATATPSGRTEAAEGSPLGGGYARVKSAPPFDGTGGEPLDTAVRDAMEPRFRHDFSEVRVHADDRAATSADQMSSRAYTLGTHIVFGTGMYKPGNAEGRRLIAHELAHVVQQRGERLAGRSLSAAQPAIQHKLVLTGTAVNVGRVIAIMNAGLAPLYAAQLNAGGEVEIHETGQSGPPTAGNQAFTTKLQSLCNEADTTAVGVGAGGAVIVGSYAGSEIDIADIEALGIGQRGWDARGALLHELVEQRQKQHGATATERAYDGAAGAHSQGLAAELGVIGAVLESDTNLVGATANPDGTMNGSRTVVFRYPDGSRYRIEVTINHNNIANVNRVKLP